MYFCVYMINVKYSRLARFNFIFLIELMVLSICKMYIFCIIQFFTLSITNKYVEIYRKDANKQINIRYVLNANCFDIKLLQKNLFFGVK